MAWVASQRREVWDILQGRINIVQGQVITMMHSDQWGLYHDSIAAQRHHVATSLIQALQRHNNMTRNYQHEREAFLRSRHRFEPNNLHARRPMASIDPTVQRRQTSSEKATPYKAGFQTKYNTTYETMTHFERLEILDSSSANTFVMAITLSMALPVDLVGTMPGAGWYLAGSAETIGPGSVHVEYQSFAMKARRGPKERQWFVIRVVFDMSNGTKWLQTSFLSNMMQGQRARAAIRLSSMLTLPTLALGGKVSEFNVTGASQKIKRQMLSFMWGSLGKTSVLSRGMTSMSRDFVRWGPHKDKVVIPAFIPIPTLLFDAFQLELVDPALQSCRIGTLTLGLSKPWYYMGQVYALESSVTVGKPGQPRTAACKASFNHRLSLLFQGQEVPLRATLVFSPAKLSFLFPMPPILESAKALVPVEHKWNNQSCTARNLTFSLTNSLPFAFQLIGASVRGMVSGAVSNHTLALVDPSNKPTTVLAPGQARSVAFAPSQGAACLTMVGHIQFRLYVGKFSVNYTWGSDSSWACGTGAASNARLRLCG